MTYVVKVVLLGMSFVSIGKILPANIKQSKIGRQIEAAMVIKELEQILCSMFGNNITFKIKIVSFRDRIFKLSSISSIIAQEIHLRERKILSRVNEKFGENTAEKIRFYV